MSGVDWKPPKFRVRCKWCPPCAFEDEDLNRCEEGKVPTGGFRWDPRCEAVDDCDEYECPVCDGTGSDADECDVCDGERHLKLDVAEIEEERDHGLDIEFDLPLALSAAVRVLKAPEGSPERKRLDSELKKACGDVTPDSFLAALKAERQWLELVVQIREAAS